MMKFPSDRSPLNHIPWMLVSHGRPLFDGQKTRKTATYALETGRYAALIGNDEGSISVHVDGGDK